MCIKLVLNFILAAIVLSSTMLTLVPHLTVMLPEDIKYFHIEHEGSSANKSAIHYSDESANKPKDTYSHKHHDGDDEHRHSSGAQHPPISFSMNDFFINKFDFSLLVVAQMCPSISHPSIDIPEDPFIGRAFRPPIS